MASAHCLLISALLLCASAATVKKNVFALWNLEEMARCALNHTALEYNNYGCWCGVGGSGTPVDDIDDCCMHHDKCYDAAVDDGDCFDVEIEYVDGYSWSCDNHVPVCSQDAGQSKCQKALCKCDHDVVTCWAKFPAPTVKPSCKKRMALNFHY
uniref:Phospholipase A2 n=1 Tax=Steinernema glaseri TaxID=37863 RepID=A0A1I7YNN6_9BILA